MVGHNVSDVSGVHFDVLDEMGLALTEEEPS
jgi:hypothetical protein